MGPNQYTIFSYLPTKLVKDLHCKKTIAASLCQLTNFYKKNTITTHSFFTRIWIQIDMYQLSSLILYNNLTTLSKTKLEKPRCQIYTSTSLKQGYRIHQYTLLPTTFPIQNHYPIYSEVGRIWKRRNHLLVWACISTIFTPLSLLPYRYCEFLFWVKLYTTLCA